MQIADVFCLVRFTFEKVKRRGGGMVPPCPEQAGRTSFPGSDRPYDLKCNVLQTENVLRGTGETPLGWKRRLLSVKTWTLFAGALPGRHGHAAKASPGMPCAPFRSGKMRRQKKEKKCLPRGGLLFRSLFTPKWWNW